MIHVNTISLFSEWECFLERGEAETLNTFPVNSFEAEGRRVSRFFNENHSQGVYTPKEEISTEVRRYIVEIENNTNERVVITPKLIEPDAEYPHTFDLRKIKSRRGN
jgi:uncharacterized protein (DUF2126 family)